MDEQRARKIGHNEAVFRQVNEQIEAMNRGIAALGDETMHIVCECGDLACGEQLVVPIQEYDRIRGDSALFLIRPGHEYPAVEVVVERAEGYCVVRKSPGLPEEIAAATDPRAPNGTTSK